MPGTLVGKKKRKLNQWFFKRSPETAVRLTVQHQREATEFTKEETKRNVLLDVTGVPEEIQY